MGSPTKVFGAGNARMRRRPLLTALLVVLALLALVAVAHRPLLRAAGHALVVNEPGRGAPPATPRGGRRVPLAPGGPPPRRVRLIWRREAAGAIEAGIVAAPDECSSADGWWRRRRCSEAVLHEYLGLFALYLNV